jgi:hypothetical protein
MNEEIIKILKKEMDEVENLFDTGKDTNGKPITPRRSDWLKGYLAGINFVLHKLQNPNEKA